jgi:3-hydroxyacyl-[acyl-carrier-protein] dehydratase
MTTNLDTQIARDRELFPFLLVDAVLDYRPGSSIKVLKNVSSSEHYFTGHFPDEAIMPGVIIISVMAQAARLLFGADNAPRMTKIQKFRFKKSVKPGDQLIVHLSQLEKTEEHQTLIAEATVENETVASGRLIYAG